VAGPIDLVLIRGLLPDVTLRPGTVVYGRVIDARTLALEGVRLAAELPDGVAPGDRLRLRVEDAGAQRLHLRVLETVTPPPAPPTTGAELAYALALPGGAAAQVRVQDRDAPERGRPQGEARAVSVRYDSPTLGRLDIRLEPGAAAVHVSAGDPAATVRGAADVLREALTRVTGRPTQVTVHPRDATLDVRA
jgi:hypothetical protein